MLDFDLVGLHACHASIASAKRGETMSDGPFLLDLDRLQLSPYEIERRKVFVDFQRGDLTRIAAIHAETNEIKIVTRMASSSRVAIEIHDTGSGIPIDVLPHIFDAFYTTKAATVGTGLGLAICRRIIADHDGEISVESRVGAGTVFRTLLPAADRGATEVGVVLPERVAGRRGRILAVDDEPMLCVVIERILRAEHDVTTVTSAKEALGKLDRGEQFDLILCDLMMPEMTGMDLHARLQQSAPDQAAKIIFMTGGAFTENTQTFLAQLTNESIEKPFKAAKLRELVHRFLR
jgi:CheY-like chemotaxis protein